MNKTMANEFMYIPNDDKQNNGFIHKTVGTSINNSPMFPTFLIQMFSFIYSFEHLLEP